MPDGLAVFQLNGSLVELYPAAFRLNTHTPKRELAGISDVLAIHVTFKSGSAELGRFYTEFLSHPNYLLHGRNSERLG